MDQITASLAALPLPSVFFVIIAGAGRAMGALFGLWGLYFVLGPAALIRMVLALIISMPAIAGNLDGFIEVIEDTQRLAIYVLPMREFVLGLALGFLASLPFFAVMGAAMMIDQYRGDFSPGIAGPEGQQIGSFAQLKVVMVLFLFVEAGGFFLLVATLYKSFGILPPAVGGFGFAPDMADQVAGILQSVFVTLILVALPIMVLLLLIEYGVSMTLRLTGQIKMPSIDFLLKNLLLALAMPLLIYGLARTIGMAFDRHPDPLGLLQRLLGS